MRLIPLIVLVCACGPEVPEFTSIGRNDGALRGAATAKDGVVLVQKAGTVQVQRLDGKGAKSGAATELSATTAAIGTNGATYRTCLAQRAVIRCGMLDAAPNFEAAGAAPELVHGPGGWVLAYAAGEGLMLQRLDGDGRALGTPVEALKGADRPLLAPTPDGVVLAGGNPVRVQRFDTTLRPVGPEVLLSPVPPTPGSSAGTPMIWGGAIAATETTTVVTLTIPYGAIFYVVQNGQVVKRKSLGAGVKLGVDFALEARGSEISAAFGDRAAGRWVRDVVADQGAALITALTDTAVGSVAEGSIAMLYVGSTVVLATTTPSEMSVNVVGTSR